MASFLMFQPFDTGKITAKRILKPFAFELTQFECGKPSQEFEIAAFSILAMIQRKQKTL
jgi:hypothetical protein